MSTNEDLENKEAEGADHESEATSDASEGSNADPKGESRAASKSESKSEKSRADADSQEPSEAIADEKDEARAEKEAIAALGPTTVSAPVQLGYRRFVYAAYFGFAIAIAFIGSKIGSQVWYRLSQYKPQWELGDPQDEIIMPLGAVLGAAIAIYYYRKPKSRQYVDDVANELSQVTWPSRKEVTSSTAVVIVTTLFATVFFALMDRFWGFVTNLVYGS